MGAGEIALGLVSEGLALMADGLQTVCEVAPLILGAGIQMILRRKRALFAPESEQRVPALAQFAAAAGTLFVAFFIIIQALEKFLAGGPPMEHTRTIVFVTLCGVLPTKTAIVMTGKDKGPAMLIHIIRKCFVPVMVILCAINSQNSSFVFLDPIISMLSSAFACRMAVPQAAAAGKILLQTAPEKLRTSLQPELAAVRALEGVLEVKDEHFWTINGAKCKGTITVRIRSDKNEERIKESVRQILGHYFEDLTIQVEKDVWISSPASSSSPKPVDPTLFSRDRPLIIVDDKND